MKQLLLIALLLSAPVSAAPVGALDDDEPSLGDDYEYSRNPLISTVEASATTVGDASTKATSEATTEATSGEQKQDHAPTPVLKFAQLYRSELAKEFAQGGGEKVVTLSALLGVPRARRDEFCRLAQLHYEELYPTYKTDTDTLLTSLSRLRDRLRGTPAT